MNKIEFNTQIATTIEQSKRLLELGLKPETADMKLIPYSSEAMSIDYNDGNFLEGDLPPAWSLHRLISMLPGKIEMISCTMYIGYFVPKFDKNNISYIDMLGYSKVFNEKSTLYDNIIDCIEWLIQKSYFNKEYLIKS